MSVNVQNYYFPLDFEVCLRFRGSMLRGKIDIGESWRPLGTSWSHLKASWSILAPFGGV